MKLKTLAVITLVVLGCGFASAQTGTFTFWSPAGTFYYDDFLVITYNSHGIVAGYDDITAFGLENAAVVGFGAKTSSDGQPAFGTGAVIGDAIYDASCVCYSGLQWTLWVSLKASKVKSGRFTGPYGWMGVSGSYTGTYFGYSYGYLAPGTPPKSEVGGRGTAAGTLPKLRK